MSHCLGLKDGGGQPTQMQCKCNISRNISHLQLVECTDAEHTETNSWLCFCNSPCSVGTTLSCFSDLWLSSIHLIMQTHRGIFWVSLKGRSTGVGSSCPWCEVPSVLPRTKMTALAYEYSVSSCPLSICVTCHGESLMFSKQRTGLGLCLRCAFCSPMKQAHSTQQAAEESKHP